MSRVVGIMERFYGSVYTLTTRSLFDRFSALIPHQPEDNAHQLLINSFRSQESTTFYLTKETERNTVIKLKKKALRKRVRMDEVTAMKFYKLSLTQQRNLFYASPSFLFLFFTILVLLLLTTVRKHEAFQLALKLLASCTFYQSQSK